MQFVREIRTVHDGQSGVSSSDTQVGLNTQLGLRCLVTKHLSLFGEWKYNRASLNFSSSTPTGATGGLKGDFSANILAFGLGRFIFLLVLSLLGFPPCVTFAVCRRPSKQP